MSTKPNANLKAVELTQVELDSVTGGSLTGIFQQLQAQQARLNLQASLNNAIKKAGSSIKSAGR